MTKVNIIFAAFLATVCCQDVAPPITPEMIKDCELLGYCDHEDGYPTELVERLVQDSGHKVQWHNDPEPTATRRSDGSFLPLCESTTQVIHPTIAKSEKAWVWVVKTENVKQSYTIELCNNSQGQGQQQCSSLVEPQEGYTMGCNQKYVFRVASVVNPGEANIYISRLRLPSCCQCDGYLAEPAS